MEVGPRGVTKQMPAQTPPRQATCANRQAKLGISGMTRGRGVPRGRRRLHHYRRKRLWKQSHIYQQKEESAELMEGRRQSINQNISVDKQQQRISHIII